MVRALSVCCALVLVCCAAVAVAGDLKGDYLEARTTDVYTGPCFANGLAGLSGRDALMAWSIERGSLDGVELAGLKVVVASTADKPFTFGSALHTVAEEISSVIIIDKKADAEQAEALVKFVKQNAKHLGTVEKVMAAPIEMNLDHFAVVGKLEVPSIAKIETRKLQEGDCVCRNETIFFPPLNEVKVVTPAYSIEAEFSGPGLASTWNHASSRSAFLASFSY